jgi:hypothetical protein
MKSLLFSIIILSLGQVNAQCVKIYVKEHLSGSPICQLSEGDYIEICEDENEVNGCPRDFYIYDKGFSSGSLTYELSLDRGWSTHYMTLMVNPSTKKFGFILQGQTAIYSYYNESELAERRNKEAEQARIENERRVREAAEAEKRIQNLLWQDQQLYPNITNLLTDGNIETVKLELQKLNFPGKFPYLNELYKKEDALLKTQIKNLLSEKKFDEAIEKYDVLNLQETKNTLNNEMQLALSGHYKKFEQPFKDEQLTKIINENKTAFSKLSVGSYKVTSDSEGYLSIDGRTLGIKSSPLTKTMGKNSEFILNTSASGTIKIEQTVSHNGAEQILVSTTKPIIETGKGKLYKHTILGGPGIWANHTKIENITIQEDIPRNRYRKVQPLIIRTTANGIEIDSKKENKLLSEGKFKNRALAVFSRSLMLGVFVYSFYVLSLIN